MGGRSSSSGLNTQASNTTLVAENQGNTDWEEPAQRLIGFTRLAEESTSGNIQRAYYLMQNALQLAQSVAREWADASMSDIYNVTRRGPFGVQTVTKAEADEERDTRLGQATNAVNHLANYLGMGQLSDTGSDIYDTYQRYVRNNARAVQSWRSELQSRTDADSTAIENAINTKVYALMVKSLFPALAKKWNA